MASMSKRAQARTEKELHDLLRVPGNAICADCGARNPSWASWNLGIFLCMRCASIHRKLGTHISKVKSLSMDTWSNDQLESMKKNGNLAVNKVYNPKNKRPDMPLDADEVDGAMERFIRKKYQEKSLSDGKPEVPRRDESTPPLRSKSPDTSPPPTLPSKKGRFFGFGLRASSSAYPLSKHDKKARKEPRVDSAFRISSEDYSLSSRTTGPRAELSDHELQKKLGQLQDMGFKDTDRNTNILKRLNGDVERTIEALVKLGPSQKSAMKSSTPTTTRPSDTPEASNTRTGGQSNNPFDQLDQASQAGISFNNTSSQPTSITTNPWQMAMSNQPVSGLEQSFANMQVTQGFPQNPIATQNQIPQYNTQVSPNIPQQYAVNSSPVIGNNPFVQAPLSAHSTGSNPYAQHMQNMPNFAPSTNPFLNVSANSSGQQPTAQGFNPFGLPPTNSPPQAQAQPLQQYAQQQFQPNIFDVQSAPSQAGLQSQMFTGMQQATHPQFMQPTGQQSPQPFPNFQYGQPPAQQFQQFQQPQQQQQPPPPPSLFQSLPNPSNPYQQQQQQQQQQFQPQPQQVLSPQQTGRHDKSSILALYNYPQFAPGRPLASIPEPMEGQPQQENNMQPQPQQHQIVSPAPSAIYGGSDGLNMPKRSATMPVSSMHSSGAMGSRNPFMTSASNSASSTPAMPAQPFNPFPQTSRHTTAESMSVNNPNLLDGRHSPDAFASLSARYVR